MYIELNDLKLHLNINDTIEDSTLQNCINATCAFIDNYCGRSFAPQTEASTRQYRATNYNLVRVDEFYTTSGFVLATDDDLDGVADNTWLSTDYQLEPFQAATPTAPYYFIRAVGSKYFPPAYNARYTVFVTAKWGYPSVPYDIQQAALLQAAFLYKASKSPEGVITNGDFGAVRTSRTEPRALALLAPYRVLYL